MREESEDREQKEERRGDKHIKETGGERDERRKHTHAQRSST